MQRASSRSRCPAFRRLPDGEVSALGVRGHWVGAHPSLSLPPGLGWVPPTEVQAGSVLLWPLPCWLTSAGPVPPPASPRRLVQKGALCSFFFSPPSPAKCVFNQFQTEVLKTTAIRNNNEEISAPGGADSSTTLSSHAAPACSTRPRPRHTPVTSLPNISAEPLPPPK